MLMFTYATIRVLQIKMDKTDITKLVKSKSERVKLVNYDAGKSDVWTSFVKVHLDDKFTNYVKCNMCSTLLKWKAKDGTSGLKAHTKACPALRSNTAVTPLTGFVRCESAVPTTSQRRQLTPTDRAAVSECIVRFCARDINVVEGQGFKEVAQKLIHLGAKYGDIQASDVLPSGRTLSRHVGDIVTKERDALKSKLIGIDRFGVTTDMWTHEDTSTPYITVTIHYITKVTKEHYYH